MSIDWSTLLTSLISVIVAFIASSGFWQYKMRKLDDKKEERDEQSAIERGVLGLLHRDLIKDCQDALVKDHISAEEYEDMLRYLYYPYKDMGGDGLVEKYVKEVGDLLLR